MFGHCGYGFYGAPYFCTALGRNYVLNILSGGHNKEMQIREYQEGNGNSVFLYNRTKEGHFMFVFEMHFFDITRRM